MSLLDEAVNPEQYDRPDMDWATEGDINSPTRQFMARAVDLRPGEVAGKSLLDVGCGTGWLLARAAELGAVQCVGLEPSQFADVAAANVPTARIERTTFDDFSARAASFDVVAFVMSTEHLPDITEALKKTQILLKQAGRVIILCSDFDAFQRERFDYTITLEEIEPEREVVVRCERPSHYGTTTDVLRSVERWRDAFTESGLRVLQHSPITVDEQFLAQSPRHVIYKEQPLFQLWRLGVA